MSRICWIRNDDSGEIQPCEEEFMQVFVDEGASLNMEVIPAMVKVRAPIVWKPFLKTNLFELHCHGRSHLEFTECNEYPDNRDSDEIDLEFSTSKKHLKKVFGDYFKPYFTAPWEKLSPEAERIVRLNFIKISPNDIPININLRIHDSSGVKRWKTLGELIQDVNSLEDDSKIGILTHHYLYKKNDPALVTLKLFIQYLKKEGYEFKKFSEL